MPCSASAFAGKLKVKRAQDSRRLQADKKTQNRSGTFRAPGNREVEIASDVPDKVILDAVEELAPFVSWWLGFGKNESCWLNLKGRSLWVPPPEGANDTRAAARAVREMFTSIAPRYDLVMKYVIQRHACGGGAHARTFAHVFSQPDSGFLIFAAALAT